MQEIEIVDKMLDRLFGESFIMASELHAWQKVKELAQQHLTQAKSKPAEIAESIKAACFPCEGEYIVPRKEWLIEWVRQLLLA